MSEPIFRIKLYEEVANHIQERIRLEQWRAGERLPAEAELAKEFDVSRSTVREAVRSLQIAGLLRSRAGAGTYVAESAPMILLTRELADIMSDPEHLQDLVRARLVLEPQLAALAAEKATAEEKEALLQMVDRMEREHDRFGLMNRGHAFHMALAAASHNLILNGFYQSAARQLRSMRVLESLTLEIYRQGVEEHRQIAKAVAGGDTQGAKEAMAAHLAKDYAEYL
ncbi:MAG: FadR family transcriptional regulator [Clostridia bacterium]|nr:FadR family transcriptional regulator [Clostridia bacterium]